jgi:integrase
MSFEEVNRTFGALAQRERLIVKIAILAGMRPGEIFGLTWGRPQGEYAEIRQRIYRGQLGSPNTLKSVREVALSKGLLSEIREINVREFILQNYAPYVGDESLPGPTRGGARGRLHHGWNGKAGRSSTCIF